MIYFISFWPLRVSFYFSASSSWDFKKYFFILIFWCFKLAKFPLFFFFFKVFGSPQCLSVLYIYSFCTTIICLAFSAHVASFNNPGRWVIFCSFTQFVTLSFIAVGNPLAFTECLILPLASCVTFSNYYASLLLTFFRVLSCFIYQVFCSFKEEKMERDKLRIWN